MIAFNIKNELEKAKEELEKIKLNCQLVEQKESKKVQQVQAEANQAIQQAYDQVIEAQGVVKFLESKIKKESKEV